MGDAVVGAAVGTAVGVTVGAEVGAAVGTAVALQTNCRLHPDVLEVYRGCTEVV